MNEIIIVFCTDDNYIMPTCVTITSIIMNKTSKSIYNINIITDSISDINKEILNNFSKINSNNLIKINILNYDNSYKNINNHSDEIKITTSALMKFDIPKIFKDYNKVLYLDSDLIILKDLEELFNTDIENCYAAVVTDVPIIANGQEHFKKLKISNYFNSGVMLLNIRLLRMENISDKLINYKINGYNRFMDQDAFNVIFDNKVKFLHYKYNYMCNYIIKVNRIMKYKVDIDDIVIIHFAGNKPWVKDKFFYSDNNYAYDYFFWYYYQNTYYFSDNMLCILKTIISKKTKSYLIYYNELDTFNSLLRENINWIKLFGIYNNRERIYIYLFGIKITIKVNEELINKIAWWIPVRKWRDKFRNRFNY